VLNPPPVLGLGQGAGYSLFVEDRAGRGATAHSSKAANALQNRGGEDARHGLFPSLATSPTLPQLDIPGRFASKAKAQGVALTNLFETLQVYLGSSYVNDFQPLRPHLARLCAGRWRLPQAGGGHRQSEDAQRQGARLVPIGSMVKISQTYGPDPVLRYNGYPAADFIGEANPATLSSAQAMGHDGRARQAGGCPTA